MCEPGSPQLLIAMSSTHTATDGPLFQDSLCRASSLQSHLCLSPFLPVGAHLSSSVYYLGLTWLSCHMDIMSYLGARSHHST